MDLDNAMDANLLLSINSNTGPISKPTTAEELFDRIKAADKPIEQPYATTEMVKNEENTGNLNADSESMDQNADISKDVVEDNFNKHVGDMRKKHLLTDSDDEGDRIGRGREEGEIHTPPPSISSAIPTISIRMKADPSGDPICIKTTKEESSSDYHHQSIKSLISPPAKKRKEDKDRSGKIDESVQEKDKNNKDRHHKDKKKKKKKKKHKQKHKHKDRHLETGQNVD